MFDFMLTSVGEKLATGGLVTLLGMGMVFAVLALLWGLVEVLHVLLNRPKKRKVTTVVEESHTAFPVAEADSTPTAATEDLSIIAVITAAIAAASGSSPSSFRVVSFKRANQKFSGK